MDDHDREPLHDAARLLKGVDLVTAWGFLSALSAIEEWTHDPLSHEVLHTDLLRIATKAVLLSEASAEGREWLTPNQFIAFRNGIHEGTGYDAVLEDAVANDPEWQWSFFSWLGNLQFRPQERNYRDKGGRFLGMFVGLPGRSLEPLSTDVAASVRSVLGEIEAAVGLAPVQMVAGGLAVILLLQRRLGLVLRSIPEFVAVPRALDAPGRREAQLRLLNALVKSGRELAGAFTFKASDLPAVLPALPPDRRPTFLRLFSSGTDEMRAELVRPEYGIGPPAGSLIPLERRPIVRLDDTGDPRFVVPFVPFLVGNLLSAADYEILSRLKDRWNTARGALLEAYLFDLVRTECAPSIMFGERVYDRSAGAKRSPDLVLLDDRGGRFILVEAKSRRLSPRARFSPSWQDFREYVAEPIEALKRLPKKWADMKRRPSDFPELNHRSRFVKGIHSVLRSASSARRRDGLTRPRLL